MSNNHFRNLPVPFLSQRQNDYLWEEEIKFPKRAITSTELVLDKDENTLKLTLDFSLVDVSQFANDNDYRIYGIVNIEKWGKYFKQTEENYLLVSDDF